MRREKLVSAASLMGWLGVSFLPSVVAFYIRPGTWYAALVKPSWNPPNTIFAPVWTLLYTAMAIAAWLVWRQGGWSRQARPLALFGLQLTLNALWTPLFFGLHWMGIAALEIALLWAAILVTLLAFLRVSRLAAALLVPYQLWVTFATALNFTLWRLNP